MVRWRLKGDHPDFLYELAKVAHWRGDTEAAARWQGQAVRAARARGWAAKDVQVFGWPVEAVMQSQGRALADRCRASSTVRAVL